MGTKVKWRFVNFKTIDRVLLNLGFELVRRKEGLQMAYSIHPASILCDWVMPEMEGVEVCRHVKACPELVSIIKIDMIPSK